MSGDPGLSRGGRPRKERPPFAPTVLRPITVTMDWLTLNMSGPWANMPNTQGELRELRTDYGTAADKFKGYLLFKTTPYPTNIHTRVDIVTDSKGEEVATIASMPYGAHAHDTQWVRVKFANRTLYDGTWYDLFRVLRMMGHEYRDIGQLDLAADAIAGDGGDFLHVIQRANAGEGRSYGKSDWSIRFPRGRKKDSMVPKSAEMGARSNKFLRVYCKTRELKQKGDKPWIREHWCAAMGGEVMPDDMDINRLEVALKHGEILRYYPKSKDEKWIEKLHMPLFRRDVFASTAPSLFDFRTYSGRARDAQPLAVWDWSGIGDVDPDIVARKERSKFFSDQSLKLWIHNLWKLSMVMSAPHLMVEAANMATAAGPHIVQWMEQKKKHWWREYAHAVNEGDERTREFLTRLCGKSIDEMREGLDPGNLP